MLTPMTAAEWLGGDVFASEAPAPPTRDPATDPAGIPAGSLKPARWIDDPVAWFVIGWAVVLTLGYVAGEPD